MADFDEKKIRDLAYQLWEQDGSPEGKDDDFWHAAQKLLADEGGAVDPANLVAELAIPTVVAPTLVK